MASLLTNRGAMTALQTLRATNMELMKTQGRMATGRRVNHASDNSAYWAIATTMRSDNMALDAVKDAIGLSRGTVDTMATALDKSIEVMKKIKEKLVAAADEGVDRQKVQDEIGQMQEQLVSSAAGAVYNEQNWLSVNSASDPAFNGEKRLVSSFHRINDAVNVETINYNIGGISLFDGVAGGILGGVAIGPEVVIVDSRGLTREQFNAIRQLKEFIDDRFSATATGSNARTSANINAALGLSGDAVIDLADLDAIDVSGVFIEQEGGEPATNQQEVANLVQAAGQISPPPPPPGASGIRCRHTVEFLRSHRQ